MWKKKKKKKIDKNNILMHLLNKEFDLCLFARSRNIRQKLSKWLTLLVILMSCHVIINYVCTRNAWQQLRQKFVFSSSYARNVMWSLMMLLTFTPLWTNSTDDNLIIFLIFQTRLDESVLTSTHNLCFWAEISTIMYNPVIPNFTI